VSVRVVIYRCQLYISLPAKSLWAGHVARMREKTEGKRPLGKPTCRQECNIRMELREAGWELVEWMHLAQDRAHSRLL
jgi:hypothetical protein